MCILNSFIFLEYEQAYFKIGLSPLDYQDYSVYLDLLPNGLTLCVF